MNNIDDYCLQAFEDVISELSGPAEIQHRMRIGRSEFMQLLGDPRKAGRWIEQTLDGLDWDWPRWHTYAKTFDEDTLQTLAVEASKITQMDALSMMTVQQLKALLLQHEGQTSKGKATKDDILRAINHLHSDTMKVATQAQVQQWLSKKTTACRQKMGSRIASRISSIALGRMRIQQLTEPSFLALHPYWEFVCCESAPKSCKKHNGKLLPVSQALQVFPKPPCDRLDCGCRVVPRRQ